MRSLRIGLIAALAACGAEAESPTEIRTQQAETQATPVLPRLPHTQDNRYVYLSFDGSTYAETPDAPVFDLDSAFVLEAVVRVRAHSADRHVIYKWGPGGVASYALWFRSGHLAASTHDGTCATCKQTIAISDPELFPLDTWHQISFVFDRGTGILLKDGVVVAFSSAMGIPMNSAQPVLVGNGFIGDVAQVRMRVPTTATASYIAYNPFQPVVYWPFNEGSGAPADEISGILLALRGAVWGFN